MKAITYLEVLLTLTIISIMAAMSTPKYNDDTLSLASDDLISQLKYISYMSMLGGGCNIDDANCLGKMWQIHFHTKVNNQDVISYTIFKDKNANSLANKDEYLKDKVLNNTVDGRRKSNDKQRNNHTFINKLYGIDEISLSPNCKSGNSFKLMFGHDGRIYSRYYKAYYKTSSGIKKCDGNLPPTAICRSKLYTTKGDVCKITLKKVDEISDICIDTKTSYVYRCK